MFQMLGVFAEFERAMIQERVRAGLARAKAGGQDTAPSSHPGETERAVQAALKKKRLGFRKIASTLWAWVSEITSIVPRTGPPTSVAAMRHC
jgi:DNA invertase Pin-like site-specific DNA recombinase